MSLQAISHRRLLRHTTLACASGALVALTPPPSLRAAEPPQPSASRSDGLNVRNFGAVGDGKQNDAPAFEAALRAASQAGGNVVRVPRCNYLIQGTLDVPENVQDHASISFVNGQFMAGIEIAEGNQGPVKFTGCGFWNIPRTDRHAVLEGQDHTTFNGCHFIGWGKKDREAPCIHARRGGLTVNACDFMDRGKVQVALESEVEAALIFGNRFRGKERILNQAGERAQIGLNAVSG